jgi:hypothetical protein
MTKKNGDDTRKTLARVQYSNISNGQFSDEYVVQINTGRQNIVGIFPSHLVDKKARTVGAYIIKESEDQYLVALPSTTFTTSSNVWFPKQHVLFEAGLP